MSLAALKRKMVVGSRFECTEHPRYPENVGKPRTITKTQTNAIVYKEDNGDGKNRWLPWPKARFVSYDGNGHFSVTFFGDSDKPFTCRYQIL